MPVSRKTCLVVRIESCRLKAWSLRNCLMSGKSHVTLSLEHASSRMSLFRAWRPPQVPKNSASVTFVFHIFAPFEHVSMTNARVSVPSLSAVRYDFRTVIHCGKTYCWNQRRRRRPHPAPLAERHQLDLPILDEMAPPISESWIRKRVVSVPAVRGFGALTAAAARSKLLRF